MLLNSLQHSATRLMSVGAVVEAAVLGDMPVKLRSIIGNFFIMDAKYISIYIV